MTQQESTYNLSRRRVLGGIGAIGIASAGAGLGTSAYFSDTETFNANRLEAGELDMLVDWQQTYYGPDGLVYVNAWPDDDDDGIQDTVPRSFPLWAVQNGYDLDIPSERQTAIDEFKGLFADVPQDFAGPLIELTDVKPGDEGEVTFSMHLFDNDGYIKMIGEEHFRSENGVTEPEGAVDGPGEDGGELAEEIMVQLWADDGDNVFEPKEGPVDVVLVMDESCSMEWADAYSGCSASENTPAPEKLDAAKTGAKTLVEALFDSDADVNVSFVSFQSKATRENDLGASESAIIDSIDALDPNNGTDIHDAILAAHAELTGDATLASQTDKGQAPSNNDRLDAEKIIVLLSDGYQFDTSDALPGDVLDAADAAKADDITIYTILYEIVEQTDPRELLTDIASDDPVTGDKLAYAANVTHIVGAFEHIALQVGGEYELFQGTLAEALDELGGGITLDPTPFGEGVDCFEWCTTYYVGFRWWLPFDVGNEVQTDSIGFDLGFYTEQCRHNDGSAFVQEPIH